MAIKTYKIDKRVFKTPTGAGTLADLEAPLNLKEYIIDVIAEDIAGTTTDLNGKKLILDADADTSITADTDDQIDIEISGADDFKFTANTFTALSGSTIATNTIAETTALADITLTSPIIQKKSASAAINASATATAAEVKTGLITSTSAAAVTITLPTGTLLGAALGATQGTIFDLVVDNSAGANTVTLAPGVNNVSSQWNVYQDVGGAPHDVVAGATGVGVFRFIFSSATACVYTRIA